MTYEEEFDALQRQLIRRLDTPETHDRILELVKLMGPDRMRAMNQAKMRRLGLTEVSMQFPDGTISTQRKLDS